MLGHPVLVIIIIHMSAAAITIMIVMALPVGVAYLLNDAFQLLRPLSFPLPLQLVRVRSQVQLVHLYVPAENRAKNANKCISTVTIKQHEPACGDKSCRSRSSVHWLFVIIHRDHYHWQCSGRDHAFILPEALPP